MKYTVTFEDLRTRACALADAGTYTRWQEIGAALEADGVAGAKRRIMDDPFLGRLLDVRCGQALARA